MIDIFSWMQTFPGREDPFLVLGKGPSFSHRDNYDLTVFNLVSLNHVLREQKVDFAHMIDIDVVEDCADCLLAQAKWLVMPMVPHVDCQPTSLQLADFVRTIPVLRQFDQEGRLLWYPLWSGPAVDGMPHIQGTFSGSVAVNLLSQLGAANVRTLGVDGGTTYSDAFEDLTGSTLFKNEHETFDIQFAEIEETVRQSGLDFKPLIDPIRVFIGGDEYQSVAAKVLEHSIRKHTQRPLQIFHMSGLPLPKPKDAANRPGTGFSFYRFLIPKLAGYKGKAIYLDADMLVFDDIAKLWDLPFNGKKVLCSTQNETPRGWEDHRNNTLGEGRYWTPGRQLSVMLLDCERLDWQIEDIVRDLDEREYTYKELMVSLCIVDADAIGDTISNEWNCLEWYQQDRSQLVHFTVVPTQPWRHAGNALNDLWENAFIEAVAQGSVTVAEVDDLVGRELLKPSLRGLAEETARSVPNTPVTRVLSEEERLRHLLWETMIKANTARLELARIKSSPAFWLEELLVRKPWVFARRTYRWLRRRWQQW